MKRHSALSWSAIGVAGFLILIALVVVLGSHSGATDADFKELEDALRERYDGQVDTFEIAQASASGSDWPLMNRPSGYYGHLALTGNPLRYSFHINETSIREIAQDPMLGVGSPGEPYYSTFNHEDIGGIERFIDLADTISSDFGIDSFRYEQFEDMLQRTSDMGVTVTDILETMEQVSGTNAFAAQVSDDPSGAVVVSEGDLLSEIGIYVWSTEASVWRLVYHQPYYRN